MTGKGTILPPISGPVSLKPIPATWYTFFEAPESCRETVVPGDLERLDDHPLSPSTDFCPLQCPVEFSDRAVYHER